MLRQRIKLSICLFILFLSFNVLVEGAVKNCAVYVAGSKNLCQTCNTGFIPIVSQTQCVTKIPFCNIAVNADPKKCAVC